MPGVIQIIISDGVFLFPVKSKKKNIQPCTLESFLFLLTRICLSISHGFKAPTHSLNENSVITITEIN